MHKLSSQSIKQVVINNTINSADIFGRSPIFYVGNSKDAEALIVAGADVNHTDHKGRTALFYLNDKDVVDVLIRAGADINTKANDGSTALHWARNNEVAEQLIFSGANTKETNNAGMAPWQVCTMDSFQALPRPKSARKSYDITMVDGAQTAHQGTCPIASFIEASRVFDTNSANIFFRSCDIATGEPNGELTNLFVECYRQSGIEAALSALSSTISPNGQKELNFIINLFVNGHRNYREPIIDHHRFRVSEINIQKTIEEIVVEVGWDGLCHKILEYSSANNNSFLAGAISGIYLKSWSFAPNALRRRHQLVSAQLSSFEAFRRRFGWIVTIGEVAKAFNTQSPTPIDAKLMKHLSRYIDHRTVEGL